MPLVIIGQEGDGGDYMTAPLKPLKQTQNGTEKLQGSRKISCLSMGRVRPGNHSTAPRNRKYRPNNSKQTALVCAKLCYMFIYIHVYKKLRYSDNCIYDNAHSFFRENL